MKHRGASSQVEDMDWGFTEWMKPRRLLWRDVRPDTSAISPIEEPGDIARSRDYEIAKQVADIVNTI